MVGSELFTATTSWQAVQSNGEDITNGLFIVEGSTRRRIGFIISTTIPVTEQNGHVWIEEDNTRRAINLGVGQKLYAKSDTRNAGLAVTEIKDKHVVAQMTTSTVTINDATRVQIAGANPRRLRLGITLDCALGKVCLHIKTTDTNDLDGKIMYRDFSGNAGAHILEYEMGALGIVTSPVYAIIDSVHSDLTTTPIHVTEYIE